MRVKQDEQGERIRRGLLPLIAAAGLADLIAVAFAAVLALRIVVGIERDAVLSTLRLSTPGRIDFSWDFARQVATYGLLPLIAVIASLFPEVGGSLFSWLEPLRRLAAP